MPSLDWESHDDGYESGPYRVRRTSATIAGSWQLDVLARPPRQPAVESSSRHRTPGAAKAAAERLEKQHLRTLRVSFNGVTATVCIALFMALAPFVTTIGTYAVALVALAVGLRSFANAVSERYEDAWGWNRDVGVEGSSPLADHIALRLVDGLREPAGHTPSSSAVRVLPPRD
ncbi:MAG TPA: hypothetical protein VGC47_04625 [Acidimicrobiia bacterium]|jgi:hypothetical protein